MTAAAPDLSANSNGELHPWCVLEEKDVIAEEQHVLRESGNVESGDELAVSFGGGGARSSAFCCGVLWALAEAGRLKHVTHLSSVSGGSIAATSYASFLVHRCREEKSRRESSEQPPEESSVDVDKWYHQVVADIILRCQQNAGYLFSWPKNCPQATSDSSRLPRQFDGLILVLVLLGVLVAAPVIFSIYYIVPLSLLLEAYFGGVLRSLFCQRKGVQVWAVIWSAPRILSVIFSVIIAFVVLALARVCLDISPRHRGFVVWRSLIQLCVRWGFSLSFVLGALVLVHVAQELDYGGTADVQSWCDAYLQNSSAGWIHCSSWDVDRKAISTPLDVLTVSKVDIARSNDSFHAAWLPAARPIALRGLSSSAPCCAAAEATTMTTTTTSNVVSPKGSQGRSFELDFFVTLALCTIITCLVAVSLLLLGYSFLWHLVLAVLLPLWFLWPASFVLQWRAFGPITGQGLGSSPFSVQGHYDYYTDSVWNNFVTGGMFLAIAMLPVFNVSHRFVHHYFRVSLQRAFYHHGEDVPMSEVAQCSRVPVLLFGATLNEFQRPGDKDAHSLFVLTQRRMGCERTQFAPAPPWLTLSTCMALSSAAIDALVLTTINEWHTRLLLAMLNLTQGDWLRFDIGQNWHSIRPNRLQRPRRNLFVINAIDRVPEVLLWISIYICLLLCNSHAAIPTDIAKPGACAKFRWYRDMALTIFGVFIGVLSFFCYVRPLSWLHASPLVRQIHMFFMSYMTSRQPPMYLYLTDGGPIEDLGLVVLLRRRRRWILSIDVGDDPGTKLLDLRNAIALAREERICSFFDPVDPRRDFDSLLEMYVKSSEPFVRFGVLYNGSNGEAAKVGEIFHVRMRLLEGVEASIPVAPIICAEEVQPRAESAVVAEGRQAAAGGFELRALEHVVSPSPASQGSPNVAGATDATGCAEAPGLATHSRSGVSSHADLVAALRPEASGPLSGAGSTASPPQPPIPRHRLGGLCCDCCHRWAHGSFPNTHTINQFFTPVMWANFCRLGRELSTPAVAALTAAQSAAKHRSAMGVPRAHETPHY